ncbi:protein Lines homolog 1 [Hydra vulgaris]|uniref:Protein Lines homolog 1 n=1 Tax=Hydra vulgaris TaxID=6087 RepID=A0ABM4CJG1_HYDVU
MVMDCFLKNWNEIHTGSEVLINLSCAIDAFENLPDSYLADLEFCESFCSAKVIQQAVNFLKHKDKFKSYTAVKFMSMIFKRLPETVLSAYINFDELQNVDLSIHILRVIYKQFKKCSIMDAAKFCELFRRYSKYANQVNQLCISLLHLKETIDVHDLISVLQCCTLLFKIYHKVKLSSLNTDNLEFMFIDKLFDALNELVYWLVNTSDVECNVGCNNMAVIIKEKQHLVWRYVVKLIFKVAIGIPDLNNFLYDHVLKQFCLNVSCYLRLNFIDNIKVVKSNFTTTLVEKNSTCIDESTARKLVLFGVKTMLFEIPDANNFDEVDLILKGFLNLLSKFNDSKSVISSLINTFIEQDDEQVLILKLLLCLFIKSRKSTKFLKSFQYINPHLLFAKLLNALFYDELVLLDWLVSVEVDFLDYFKLYVSFIIENFEFFVNSFDTDDYEKNHSKNKNSLPNNLVENINSAMPLVTYSSSDEDFDDSNIKEISIQLDKIMSCFIRLRLMLERMNNQNLLSIEATFIIHLLEKVEDFYDEKFS